MSNEMLARVADAILTSSFETEEWSLSIDGAKKAAVAAIEAMREPTDEQYSALCATNKIWRELDSRTVWQTYIDAATKDTAA